MRTSAELVCSVTSLTRLSWRWLRPPLLLPFRPVAARPAWYNQTSRKTTSHEGWLRCRRVYHQMPTHLSQAPSQDRTPLLGFDEEQTRTAPCPSPFPPWHSACLTRGSVQKGPQGKVGVECLLERYPLLCTMQARLATKYVLPAELLLPGCAAAEAGVSDGR